MALHVGIVGLPNVGKSTLFNAVSAAGVEAANYPFATIEPNVGVAAVPDPRLARVAEVAGSARAAPATVEFRDIAGLVAGASRGEGLGNQFLSHIREVDALVHVVRCFADDDVVHVEGTVDPVRDIEVVETELALKDLESVGRRVERSVRDARGARSGDRVLAAQTDLLARLQDHLGRGEPARTLPAAGGEEELLRELFLLTAKPVLYVANVGEDDLPDGGADVARARARAGYSGAPVVVVSAEAEAQIARLEPGERAEFRAALGLERSGLDQLVTAAYRLLGLITFFTADRKEARACTVPAATPAPRAAREIHSDIERGFIRAEVVDFADLDRLGSEQAVRDAGRMRIEGRDYLVTDGDVIHFRFTTPK